MQPLISKLGVRNARSSPQLVVIEPWANDYTLLQNEELLVLAYGNAVTPWFDVVELDGVTQVFCEDAADFKVFQGNTELECGHQRQPSPI